MDVDATRWCVHCGADCWPSEDAQAHQAHCPEVTGLWPVDDHLTSWGAKCGRCHQPFAAGGFYLNVPLPTQGVVEATCIGCGIQAQLEKP